MESYLGDYMGSKLFSPNSISHIPEYILNPKTYPLLGIGA